MAKKNKINSKILYGGLGVTGVLIGVLIFLFVPISSLGYVDQNPPTPQQILDEVNKVKAEFDLEITCLDVTDCADEFEEIENEKEEFKPVDVVFPPEPITIVNETESNPVKQPPPTQTPATTIQLVSKVIKTDNNGTKTESKTNVDIPLLSFFVEDTTNRDFDNGFLEQSLLLVTDPNIPVTANADYNILINGVAINTDNLKISTQGTTDENGEILLDFLSPTSVPSKTLTFSFKANLDKFNPNGLSKVDFVLFDIMIDANNQKYGLVNSTVFSMDIARDPNQILITNEDGSRTRVFPTDDVLTIGSYALNWNSCQYISNHCYVIKVCTAAKPTGGGTIQHLRKDGITELVAVFPPTPQGSGPTYSSPTVYSCSSHVAFSGKIQRDEIYKIDFNNPAGSITFKTAKEQKNYDFRCTVSQDGLTLNCNYKDPAVIAAMKATLDN